MVHSVLFNSSIEECSVLTLAVSDFQDESSTYSLSVRDAWGFENRTLSLTC